MHKLQMILAARQKRNNDFQHFGKEAIAAKIRKLREGSGYSQEFVAYQLSMSQPAYSKKEAGRTDFTIHFLLNISNLYNLSLVDMLGLSTQELLRRIAKN